MTDYERGRADALAEAYEAVLRTGPYQDNGHRRQVHHRALQAIAALALGPMVPGYDGAWWSKWPERLSRYFCNVPHIKGVS